MLSGFKFPIDPRQRLRSVHITIVHDQKCHEPIRVNSKNGAGSQLSTNLSMIKFQACRILDDMILRANCKA
jgi:hypothetical protein